jgi:hypothetical protein
MLEVTQAGYAAIAARQAAAIQMRTNRTETNAFDAIDPDAPLPIEVTAKANRGEAQ